MNKQTFLDLIVKQAIEVMRHKIKSREVDPTKALNLSKEVADARAAIGSKANSLGITDADLKTAICRVAAATSLTVIHDLNLEVRLSSAESGVALDSKANVVASSKYEPPKGLKGLAYQGLKQALGVDARQHLAAKTMKLPVDLEEFAARLEKGPSRLIGLSHRDYVEAIREVCLELNIEIKAERC